MYLAAKTQGAVQLGEGETLEACSEERSPQLSQEGRS